MGRPNFYLLLEIDPTVEDWGAIQSALTQKRREWSAAVTMGNPTERRKKEGYLKLLPEIETLMSQPEHRREEARAARQLLVAEEKEKLRHLDDLIEMLGADNPDRTYAPGDLKLLVKKSGKSLTGAQIESRLRSAGFRPQANEPEPPKGPEPLESTVAKSIRANLDLLSIGDLYQFLESGAKASPKSLFDRADAIYKDLNRRGKTDPESSARQELAGLCKSVFRDAGQKARYDKTLALEAMETLRPTLEIAGRNKILSTEAIEQILRRASRLGVAKDDGLAYLEDLAAKRKWTLQRQGLQNLRELRRCGFCSALVEASAVSCPKCGEALERSCLQCGFGNPSDAAACGRCGGHFGDEPLVKSLLAAGKRRVSSGELESGLELYDRALRYWPDWKPLTEAHAEARARQREREETLAAVRDLVDQQKLGEARRRLADYRRRFGELGTRELESRIQQGRSRAEKDFEKAQRAQRGGQTGEALDLLTKILRRYRDFEPAREALRAIPPEPPASLEVEQVGPQVVRLKWSRVEGSGELKYRILRKAKGQPSGPEDGDILGTTLRDRFDDAEAPLGTPLFYGVFSLRSEVPSRDGAFAAPCLLTSPIRDLEIEVGDRRAVLTWKSPRGAEAIEVRYGVVGQSASRKRTLEGADRHCVVTGLKNRQPTWFRVTAIFAGADGARERAQGVGVEATPQPPPPPITDLKARSSGSSVDLGWQPPAPPATTQLLLCRQEPAQTPGQLLSLRAAERLGDPVASIGRDRARIELPTHGAFFLVPLTVDGDLAVVGKSVLVRHFEEVGELRARRKSDTVIVLTWEWPADATECLVVYSHRQFPERPEEGTARPVRRDADQRTASWTLAVEESKPHFFTVFVRDEASGHLSQGAKVAQNMGKAPVVDYRVVVERKGFWRGQSAASYLELTSGKKSMPIARLTDLQLVYGKELPPLGPEEGELLYSIPEVELVDGAQRLPIPDRFVKKGYVKLFFEDPEKAQEIRLRPANRENLRLA